MKEEDICRYRYHAAYREAETDSPAGKPEMDTMRSRIRQDQEPDIDAVLSRQGLERIYEFGFKYPDLEYDQGDKWSSASRG